jgi:hypothetical protein
MILKIEQWIHLPYERHPGAQDPNGQPPAVPNKRKVFHLIDHVEDVKYGDVAPINDLPTSVMHDGVVNSVEVFLNEDRSNRIGEKSEGAVMMNIIQFRQGGREQRTIACVGNVYLCNDAGDTLEIIRAVN